MTTMKTGEKKSASQFTIELCNDTSMTEYCYTHLEGKADLPAEIAFLSSPVGFHTEVVTRFAHHPGRKVFQVCCIEHIL